MNRHFGALILITVFAVAGCTYTDSGGEPPQPRTSGSAATTATPNSVPRTVQGNFQSQAANTRGTATIRVTDSGATLELKDFATENSKDLRVFLSPGTLSPGANGKLGLTSTVMYELGALKSSQGDQQYEIGSQQWANTPAIGSVVIYDYSARLAYGAANLR
ncbi:DM13 domain-containing protein [Arthrobacter sp. FW306-2-2C-D06B]|uniref:DM13 domain-containing protein n=1 Tax=Arthrobacter sp. FW306-2-2C-D06B TaxID=2879618 RepID=UPI001F3238EE|nr:DM13 domain-containing protein [Arthrobacter sp. FW306-2-2C-D06B]UKA59299.1 DM13 domain-containing protein [Arthrobacter sp. FW306-2-2C-D06B]